MPKGQWQSQYVMHINNVVHRYWHNSGVMLNMLLAKVWRANRTMMITVHDSS